MAARALRLVGAERGRATLLLFRRGRASQSTASLPPAWGATAGAARGLLSGGSSSGTPVAGGATSSASAPAQQLAGGRPPPPGGSQEPSPWAGRLAGISALGAVAIGGAALVSLHASSEPADPPRKWQLIPQETQAATFFKYEKRLRNHSDTEKIFDYFSSIKHGKHKYMTEADLMRSVIPVYPMDGVRTGSLDGESSAPKPTQTTKLGGVIDSDGDDRISFAEYLFFLKLMSIGVENLETVLFMIDIDQSGSIDKDEMLLAVGWSSGTHQRGVTRTGLAADSPNASIFIPQLFGADGKKLVPLAKVKVFLERLHEDLAELEFRHYDCQNKGFIPGHVFALAAVAAAPLEDTDMYLKRIKGLPQRLRDASVSREGFKAFVWLSNHREKVDKAVDFWRETSGEVTLDVFKHTVQYTCGSPLSDEQMEILYELFQPATRGKEVPFPKRFQMMLELRGLEKRVKQALTTPAQYIRRTERT